jgi:hypothetical protein
MPAVPNTPQGEPEAAPPEAPATPETAAPEAAPPAQPDGLDRIYERMEEMSAQQRQMAEQLGRTRRAARGGARVLRRNGRADRGRRAGRGRRLRPRAGRRPAGAARGAGPVEKRDEEWEALKESTPELADPKYAQEVIAHAVAWANAHNPDLIDRPEFVDVIEWVHKVRKYDESAAAQTPAGRGVVLESAAGAAQPSGLPEEDWGERIVKAAEAPSPSDLTRPHPGAI